MRTRFAALAFAVAALTVIASPAAAAPAPAEPTVDRTITDARVEESSGLAVSALHPGVLYTHNDSGDGPRVFAIAPDGTTSAVLTLRGVEARDWEAISPGRRGSNTFWVGDIGDNIHGWTSYPVYRVDEPKTLRTQDVAYTKYVLTYPDGSHNAESLLVHPVTGRLYVVTKQVMGGAIYEAPAKLSTTGPNVLRRVAKALPYATDAAFSPDGRYYVVRGYVDAVVYATDRPGVSVASLDLPAQPQGESIAWSADGAAVYVGSEGPNSKVYRVPLPASLVPASGPAGSGTAGSATASPTPTATSSIAPSSLTGADDGRMPRKQVLWLGAGAIVLVVLGLSMRSYGRLRS